MKIFNYLNKGLIIIILTTHARMYTANREEPTEAAKPTIVKMDRGTSSQRKRSELGTCEKGIVSFVGCCAYSAIKIVYCSCPLNVSKKD